MRLFASSSRSKDRNHQLETELAASAKALTAADEYIRMIRLALEIEEGEGGDLRGCLQMFLDNCRQCRGTGRLLSYLEDGSLRQIGHVTHDGERVDYLSESCEPCATALTIMSKGGSIE